MPNTIIKASFQEGRVLGKVTIESTNLKFISIGNDDNAILSSLFDINKNPESVKGYGDGTHADAKKIATKISLWGGRAESGEALRAFFVYKNGDAEKPIGFVNLGVNSVNINNIEIGIFFDDEILSSKDGVELASEAVHVASIEYPEYVKANSSLLSEKQFVFYDASFPPLQQVAKVSGFNPINTLNELCTTFGQDANIKAVEGRFSQQGDQLFDCGRHVLAFFYELDEVTPLGVSSGAAAAAGLDGTSDV